MRSQFWKQIEPIEGQPIPEITEYRTKAADGVRTGWIRSMTRGTFFKTDRHFEWRCLVEACPMSIAVDAIAIIAQFNHDKQLYEVWIVDNYASGCTEQALKDAIASRLRELADKEFPE